MRQQFLAALILGILVGPGTAWAQTAGANPASSAPFGSPVDDEHVWTHLTLDQFETRLGSENSMRWDGEAWMGTDTHRLWLKSEGDVQNGKLSDGEHEILYDTPLSTYFDVQAGLRYDLDQRAGRGWGVIGIEGLAPYFFHVAATAYASDTGHYGAKFSGSYDFLITQRLILQPAVELNLYTKSDPKRQIGSGLSNLDSGLRLRYEITRKFAPYIGVSYEKQFGETGRLAAAAGEKTDALRFTAGLRFWF
jgi:copper resistance protein B